MAFSHTPIHSDYRHYHTFWSDACTARVRHGSVNNATNRLRHVSTNRVCHVSRRILPLHISASGAGVFGDRVFSIIAGDPAISRDGTLSRVSSLSSRRDAALFHSRSATFSRWHLWGIHQDKVAHPKS